MPLHNLSPTPVPKGTEQCIECGRPMAEVADYGACTYRRVDQTRMLLFYCATQCYKLHVEHAYHNGNDGGIKRCTVEKVPYATT